MIHAHFEVDSSDCDGRTSRSYVVPAYEDEDDLDFHERIVLIVVNTYGLLHSATLHVSKTDAGTRLVWSEPTEEGGTSTDVTICTRDCDETEHSYTDHRAQEMGY